MFFISLTTWSLNTLAFICLDNDLVVQLMVTPFLTAGQQTRNFIEAVEQYAHLGLRTLCLAWRELKEDEYREWSLMFKEASSTLVDREVKGILVTDFIYCNSKKLLSQFTIFHSGE